MPEIRNMEQLVDYLIPLIGRQFSDEISYVYFGDIGLYPPAAFKKPNKEEAAAIAIVPNFQRPVANSLSQMSIFMDIGVFIAVMVNMTPYFTRLPQEAFGERKLVQLTQKIAAFLQQDENMTLQRQVGTSRVNSIDWEWLQRGEDSIRSAAIDYQVTIEVDRLEL